MIPKNDKRILTEVGRDYILDLALNSTYLKDTLTFKEHVDLCKKIQELTYEEVIALTITEDIRSFESKFGKFLKYSIAAIAGMKFIGALSGPPVAMFLLYLYRKATDTCVRSCFTKLPLSNERKICKYECQLAAARKMANDLRSEINKCGQFEYADKCEKKLQGEYIKWAKRVQQLIVKLNQAKANVEEKRRKARTKELAKKAQSLRAGVEMTPAEIKRFIVEDKVLRKKLTFAEHLSLYNVSKYLKEEDNVIQPVKIDPKKEKMIRTVLYLGLWAVPVPFFNDVINYMVKKYSFACVGKCANQNKLPKNVCYHQCSYLGAKYANTVLSQQLSKCNKSKDPVKCKRRIYKMQEDWKQREVERKIKFETSLKQAIRKAKAINQKGNK